MCDSKSAGTLSVASLVPPSSNPKSIYNAFKDAVAAGDQHHDKIGAIRASYASLSTQWVAAGEITSTQRDEIIFMTNSGDLRIWRPLLYVIHRASVETRLLAVPPAKRASFGPEYIIADLRRDEFDIVEL